VDLATQTTTVETYKVGTLVVDLFDAKTEKSDLAKLVERYALRQGGQNTKKPRQGREQNVPAFSTSSVDETLRGGEMNRHLTFSLAISMTLSTLAIPMRAANKPRAGTDSQNPVSLTNDDLERLHDLGLICIVGRIERRNFKVGISASTVRENPRPGWYAEAGGENCAMNSNADGLSSVDTGRRSKMPEVSGKQRAA